MKTLVRDRSTAAASPGRGAGRAPARLGTDFGSLSAIVNSMQTRVMVADLDLNLVFLNDLAMRTMRGLERQLIDSFGVSVDQLLDGSIHRFHKDPSRIEQILRDVGSLPRAVSFTFGGRILQGSVNALNVDGQMVGYVVNWEDMTDEIARTESAEAAAADAKAVQQTMSMLSGARTTADAVRAAIDTVRSEFGWAYGSYWKLDPGSQALRFDTESGEAGDEFRRVTREASFTEGVGLSGRAWRSRDLVFVKDLAELKDCVRGPAALRAGVKSGICFPITSAGKVIGTMDFFATEVLDPDQNRLDTLRSIGQLVSQTIDRVVAQEREQERSKTVIGNAQALAAAAEELQVVSVQMGANSTATSREVTQIAAASTQVSASIDSVSAGAEEMSASIKEIARNASDATLVANHAVEDAKEATAKVGRLGESSTEIGQIVKVITGIAQQTNLLALNATIEAARAGEAGKGFAVVANEVKELAKATAAATEDISRKIESIQGETQRSVAAIGSITTVINQIADFQNSIASPVEEQAATTNDMARSVTEASRGATQIAGMLTSVRQAAESTAAGATDSQHAASELAELAAALHSLVDDSR